jgi:hypothetical protein
MSAQDTPTSKHLDMAFVVEVSLCIFLVILFSWMFAHSYEWEIEAGLFPRLISSIGVLSALAYLGQLGWRKTKGGAGQAGRILDIPWSKVQGDSWAVKKTAIGVIAWALAFWFGIVLVGFHVAAPLYLYSQLVIYGNLKKWIAALGAGVCLLSIGGNHME